MRTRRGHLPVQIGVRLQSSLKVRLDQCADAEEVSVSTLVRTWIQEHAKRDLLQRGEVQGDVVD
jgi:predicted transcriptional regulator